MQLVCLGLLNGGHADLAVLVVSRAGSQGKTVLQQLDIQVAVGIAALGHVPDPNQIAAAGGVQVPVAVLGLNVNGGCGRELLLGKGGSLLTPLLDLAGGLGSVDGQVTGLQQTGLVHFGGNMEMGGVAVHEISDGDFLLGGLGIEIQLHLCGIVDKGLGRPFAAGICGGVVPGGAGGVIHSRSVVGAACQAAQCNAQGYQQSQ